MNTKHADIWVVAGPPGSGKTVIANMLLDQEPPVKHITIDNRLPATHSLQEQLQGMLKKGGLGKRS
jgi:ABC-type molybdenum transport system ATPase subunit/photorepair protein PhrA